MKVICVDTPRSIAAGTGALPIVIVGEKYTVNDESTHSYELVEHIGFGYAKRCFIPCSDIDERELLEQRQTQYA